MTAVGRQGGAPPSSRGVGDVEPLDFAEQGQASLALPLELRCVRCAKINKAGATKPGASCPLSYYGHDCHNAQGKTAGWTVLCPDGCLRHNGQGGEIPSLAKCLAAPSSGLPG